MTAYVKPEDLARSLDTREHARTDPVQSRYHVDARALARDLERKVKGEVRFDEGSRALYSHDSSHYRQVPIGVVVARDIDDVVETVAICRKHGAPILGRGGGTSLAGQCVNAAVVVDMSKYVNQVLELDPGRKIAVVQPGLVLDSLQAKAQEHGLMFGPDPSTHWQCTFGGMIGNDSCGVHSMVGGRTVDNVEELEILTYDGLRMRVGKTDEAELDRIIREGGRRGEIYRRMRDLRDRYAPLIRERYPNIPRLVSGYSLDHLLPENGFHVARALVGSESTLVLVLEATVRLIPSPNEKVTVVLGYPDIGAAGDAVAEIRPYEPFALENLDSSLTEGMKKKGLRTEYIPLLPEGSSWLLVEFGGDTKQEAVAKAEKLMRKMRWKRHGPSIKLVTETKEQRHIWEVRESGYGGTDEIPGEKDKIAGWEDSAVPPEKVGQYLRDLQKLVEKHNLKMAMYGHIGQGCVHTRINFDMKTHGGVRNYRSFVEEAADLVVSYGGSLSGEHGDGQSRGELLPKMFGPELMEAMREFKSIWDPEWKMNPGKVVQPYRLDENLRFGTDYNPPEPITHFQYPQDMHSFIHVTERCLGVGKCRRLEPDAEQQGVMCPSFMVTREEKHSTRGRARLLFEMLQGDPMKNGWRDEAVREALDLCLACKGCKSDCPMNVDMATYKAEFLSHYYDGKLRPRHAYAFGLIMYWALLGSRWPHLVNLVTHVPGLSAIAKKLADMAPERRIPPFAPQTFREWFARRGDRNLGQPRVILWADTFNNHFFPETEVAAVEVLEAAGFQVVVPEQHLCCGRPLYDYGFLDLAKKLLKDILLAMRTDIMDGTPIVVLEPSCASVFKDELDNFFPNDQDAQRMREQVFILSEFLEKKAPHFKAPELRRKALIHGHCHHKSVLKMESEKKLLQQMGLDFEQPDPGCCGMAGAFGFEAGEHYEVSIKVGEQRLIPAVKKAPKNTLIIANGFSCREQISQTTDRRALHLSQILQMALKDGPTGAPGAYPEDTYVGLEPNARKGRSTGAWIAGLALGAAAGAAVVAILKSSDRLPPEPPMLPGD